MSRISSTISLPPEVIQHSFATLPIRRHSLRHIACNASLMRNASLMSTKITVTIFAIPAVIVPKHYVMPLKAVFALCNLGMRYLTSSLVDFSRIFCDPSSATHTFGIGKLS